VSGVLVFDSTSVALKTERLLKSAGVTVAVIPTPLDVSSGCGIALLLSDDHLEAATEVLDDADAMGYRLIVKDAQ